VFWLGLALEEVGLWALPYFAVTGTGQ